MAHSFVINIPSPETNLTTNDENSRLYSTFYEIDPNNKTSELISFIWPLFYFPKIEYFSIMKFTS